ncbi:UNKNOWN [Stylonychia lemnae]|uniref:Uncharacterized protein n=1 Tax=Stylonychia lemnae TaxID=5949 RepID=A0A077ZWF6_STYLE|nr:UNKNOWN [Stylonychia lemnae]|eukprot:CDW73600.1 UNKNOWN [Stylonychia lemnae]
MFMRFFGSLKKADEEPDYTSTRDRRSTLNEQHRSLFEEQDYEDEYDNYQDEKVVLPKDFARQVIKLEIQCERPDAVKGHLAIEYYNTKGDYDNQTFYQNKMKAMMTKTEILTIAGITDDPEGTNESILYQKAEKTRNMTLQQIREKQISKKKLNDALQLEVYKHEKKNAKIQEQIIEEKIEEHNDDEALKLVKKEQNIQSEQFRMRLAQRKKQSFQNRSMNFNIELSGGLLQKSPNRRENKKAEISQDNNESFGHSLVIHESKFSLQIENDDKKQSQYGQSAQKQAQKSTKHRYSSSQSVISFGNRSNTSLSGGGLAARITSQIQLVVQYIQNEEQLVEKEIFELQKLFEDLNIMSDLAMKITNLTKIFKMLETNDDFFSFEDSNPESNKQEETFDPKVPIKLVLDQFQVLMKQKEREVEDFLESLSEEKFQSTQEIKMKYQKMINMLKNSKDPTKDDKIQNYENKKQNDIEESQRNLNLKKSQGLIDIKNRYNQESLSITLDSIGFAENLRKNLQKVGQDSKNTKKVQRESMIQQIQQQISNGGNVQYGIDQMRDYQFQHRESTGYIGQKRK